MTRYLRDSFNSPSNGRKSYRRRASSAVGLIMLVVALVAACTNSDDPPQSTMIGTDGGIVTTPDGAITINAPAGAATDSTSVNVDQDATPVGPQPSPWFVPLNSFTVDINSGRLDQGTVTVRYNDDDLARLGTSSNLLVMLVSDHNGGWTALPTQVDTAAHTATANFPHFSDGIFGGLRSLGDWFVDHVITYAIGPEKKPNCDKKGWRGADQGWTVSNTNWDGGRILVNPLDACVEGGGAYGEPQHVEATNRYWYSWDLHLPEGATVSLDDAMNADSVGDFLLTGLYYRLFHATLIPGHSFAQFTVPGNPEGQTLTQSAIADPVSYVVNTIITGLTIASLGELQAERAALKAAEDELWANGVDTPASIAAKTVQGSEWRAAEDAKIATEHGGDSTLVKALNSFYDSMSVASCIVDALKDELPATDFTGDSSLNWSAVGDLLKTGIDKCGVEIVSAILGAGVKWAVGKTQGEIAKELAKSIGDPKALQSGIEGAGAAVALD